MLTRICDGCGDLIIENTFVRLTKEIFETKLDNHQRVKPIYGDYCNICLDNGMAIKDLLNGIDGNDSKLEPTT